MLRDAYLRLIGWDPFLWIQASLRSPWLDGPSVLLTTACEGWALALIGALLVMAMEARRDPRQCLRRRWLAASLPLGGALAVTGVVVHVVKAALDIPRPLALLGPERVHVLLAPLHGMALPSGHAASVAALAAHLTTLYPGRLRGLWMFAALGGLSRVYVGAHWFFDVVFGSLLGAAFGWAAARFASMRWRNARARTGHGSAPSETSATP